ncbi:MAG TPA: hypothetical protein VJK09_03325 [Candidatus Paceibacterota bacterium]
MKLKFPTFLRHKQVKHIGVINPERDWNRILYSGMFTIIALAIAHYFLGAYFSTLEVPDNTTSASASIKRDELEKIVSEITASAKIHERLLKEGSPVVDPD